MIKHTEKLLEEKKEKLCVKILKTLMFLSNDLSQSFFKVFFDKMKDSQQEIKSSAASNANESKLDGKDKF